MSEDYSKDDMERDYYLGFFQNCINKATSLPASKQTIYYLCLCYCHTRKWDSFNRELEKASLNMLEDDDTDNDDDQDKKFVDVLKLFKNDVSTEGGDSSIVKALDELDAKKMLKKRDELSRLLASGLYARHKSYSKALQLIDHFKTIRASHTKVAIYLMMYRFDLAAKQVVKMQKKDEKHPLTELTVALVSLANGDPDQALEKSSKLSLQFQLSPLLANIQTAALIYSERYDTAKNVCVSSLDIENDNVESLINIIHILHKTKASAQVIQRYLERLKDLHPNHEFVKELGNISVELSAC